MAAEGGAETASVRVEKTAKGEAACDLRVEVDAQRVRDAFDRAYRNLGRKARVRGFRPGKTPRSVLERLYGPVVAEDVERSLVAETFPEAVECAGVVPVGEPGIDSAPPSPGEPFRYTARLEVKPKIEIPDVRGLRARRPSVEVGEEEIVQALEELRERHAILVEEPEETPIARGNVVTVNFEGRLAGQPFPGGSGRDVKLEIGSGRFLPEFEEQLEGVRTGEEREIRARFPEDHGKAELAGQEVEFSVRVVAVQRRERPELDDEFAKDVGNFASLDALRQQIREDLWATQQREAEEVLRRTLLDSLLERVKVEVPSGVVESRLQHRLAAAEQEFRGRVPPAALRSQIARWREEWRSLAEREIRKEWVLEAVARQQELSVGEEELQERVASLAEQKGTSPARLRKAYAQAGVLEALRDQMLEERALEFLLGGAKVEETTNA